MWWPSFCSVIVDLWRFAIGREAVAVAGAPVQTELPRGYQVQEPVVTKAAPPRLMLSPQIRYSALHATTEGIREYLTTELQLPARTDDLSPYEWLAYRYHTNGRSLPWLTLGLAAPGQWHQALRGLRNVIMSLTPRTQAVMEWRDSNQVGHLGYVTGVTPDETITFEELGGVLPGVMVVCTMDADTWKEWRPVFITVE